MDASSIGLVAHQPPPDRGAVHRPIGV